MTRGISLFACLGIGMCGLLGCAEKSQKMDMANMAPPQRPAALDMLNPWVGTWEANAEFTGPDGKPMAAKGTSTVQWELDNTVLVERGEHDMGEMGKGKFMIVFSYDAKDEDFEAMYYSSFGEAGEADMWFDKKANAWEMRGEPTYNPMMGKETIWEGTLTMPDSNTMVMKMATYDVFMGMKGRKLSEGTSTAHKRG